MIMDWPEGKDFRILAEEEMTEEEPPLYNKLPENEKKNMLCLLVGPVALWESIRDGILLCMES